LRKAFLDSKNIIICDKRDLDKRATLTYFLRNLFEKTFQNGSCLIIASESKIAVWESMLRLLTNLRTFIYHDVEE